MPDATVTFDDATAYERFMGRWSRAVGEKFLAWLDPPRSARWLDIGCGTGAFSELILERCAPKSVTGIDPAPAQIDYARRHIPVAEFKAADSMALPFGDGEFDVAVSALVLHFIPDRGKAFAEMKRVVRPGGIVAGYTWRRTAATEFAPYVPMMRGLESMGEQGVRSPLVPEANPDGLAAALDAAGFSDKAVISIEVFDGYRDFDDYWDAQTAPFSPVGRSVAPLSDAKRKAFRELMRKRMPPQPDGSIRYSAQAVAFKARK
jgi:SAM-dependent methyltransferase